MSVNRSVRQLHRWVSVVFVLAFLIVSGVTMGAAEPAEWVYLLPLLPLFVLALTGIYLFALPYSAKRRGGGTGETA